MTEADWLKATDPVKLAEATAADRRISVKQRSRIALACCKRLAHLLPDEVFLRPIRLLEKHLRRPVPVNKLNEAFHSTWEAIRGLDLTKSPAVAQACCAATYALIVPLVAQHLHLLVEQTWSALAEDGKSAFDTLPPRGRRAWRRRLRRSLCGLIRDVAGNPYQSPRLDPAWRTPLVEAIAQQADAEQDFTSLPVLGDALEDAGCNDPFLLDHLRWSTDHVPGCWALEALLGR